MERSRRRFLSALGGASLLAAARAPKAFGAAADDAPHVPHAPPIDDTWDVTWAERVQGRFRAGFDSPNISDGAAVFRAILWCNEYQSVYGTPPTDMSPVVVLRHEGIPLAMTSAYWKAYHVGKDTKTKTPAGKKWIDVNPISFAAPDARYSVEHLIASGGIVLACNLAFGDIVETVGKAARLDPRAARARALEQLLPGVILQPSGVFAVLRAQEAGCKYILAS